MVPGGHARRRHPPTPAGARLKILFSTGYAELQNYWGAWPFGRMMGGTEHMLTEVACELAKTHEVTVRLPYGRPPTQFRGVAWVGLDHPAMRGDVLFCFDDFDRRDDGSSCVLVACRSDPPRLTNFDELVFYSRTHARLMGHPQRPAIGGGVSLEDYREPLERIPRRVIATGSPDRLPAAGAIGASFDFLHTYKPVWPGLSHTVELSRPELVKVQRTAQVLIHPCDPVRPAEWFSMAILEAMAAGTPVLMSDADALPELWAGTALMLPRPIDLSDWVEDIEWLMDDKQAWANASQDGRRLAANYDWSIVAPKYLELVA